MQTDIRVGTRYVYVFRLKARKLDAMLEEGTLRCGLTLTKDGQEAALLREGVKGQEFAC